MSYPSWESTYAMFYEASPNPYNWARLVVAHRINEAMERTREQAAAARQ